jgi:hypothetical protein
MITSSPGPTSNAASATCSAAVPDVTASAYLVCMRAAYSFSKIATFDCSSELAKRNGLRLSSTCVSCACSCPS